MVLQSPFFEFCVEIVRQDVLIPLLLRQASEVLEPTNKSTFLDISFPRAEYNVDLFLCAVKQILL
jgi:hypothetical protein